MVKIYSCYNPPPSLPMSDDNPTLSQQQFAEESKIGYILKRYDSTGYLYDPLTVDASRKPIYGDFTTVLEFQEAQNLICEAREKFDELPVYLRDRFDYSPVKLLQFLNDKSNYDEAVKLGLIDSVSVTPAPDVDQVVS